MSIHSINKAISLKPNYRDSYVLKGQLLKKFGRTSEARETFNYILSNLSPNDQEVLKEVNSL
jgi:Flp pilus assembly protein TadD